MRIYESKYEQRINFGEIIEEPAFANACCASIAAIAVQRPGLNEMRF